MYETADEYYCTFKVARWDIIVLAGDNVFCKIIIKLRLSYLCLATRILSSTACWSVVTTLRGHLHVYESVYDSPYDFLHNLHASQIGFQFFI
jgi:hypothetical protein